MGIEIWISIIGAVLGSGTTVTILNFIFESRRVKNRINRENKNKLLNIELDNLMELYDLLIQELSNCNNIFELQATFIENKLNNSDSISFDEFKKDSLYYKSLYKNGENSVQNFIPQVRKKLIFSERLKKYFEIKKFYEISTKVKITLPKKVQKDQEDIEKLIDLIPQLNEISEDLESVSLNVLNEIEVRIKEIIKELHNNKSDT
ncbi:hypothetical protein [Staphylococcus shinii]|uniref:hypothetical protein n=1 Tax=Staphylococcus shinii TaxID=2912228 RepID=UPI002E18BECA|nr:hypothetical protein [Staphylococcus shinii]